MQRIATLGHATGHCNICGVYGKLTADHSPPKGCASPTKIEVSHVVAGLTRQPTAAASARILQNGLSYKTLCANCNNNILGAKYDPTLIEFSKKARVLLTATPWVPDLLSIPTQPQKLMRAVLGHLCAIGVDRYRKGPKTEVIRDYLLEDRFPFPEGLDLYYWAYPFGRQVLVRDGGLIGLTEEPFMFWLLKFYPVAFMITWDVAKPIDFGAHNLSHWRHADIETAAELPFRVRPLIHEYFPEAPTQHAAVMYGDNAVTGNIMLPRTRQILGENR